MYDQTNVHFKCWLYNVFLRVIQQSIVVAFITIIYFALYVSEDLVWNQFHPKSSLKVGRM